MSNVQQANGAAKNEASSSLEVVEVIENVKECIVAHDGDLWITARICNRNQTHEGKLSKYCTDAKFKVKKQVLADNSTFFKAMFRPHFAKMKESTSPIVRDISSRPAIDVVLRVLHGSESEIYFTVCVERLWYIISVCDRLQIDLKYLTKWFATWYKENESDLYKCGQHLHGMDGGCRARQLLFPCYALNHAAAFMQVTEHLVYTTPGHISEKNPTSERHLWTPVRIVQQLNGAKGRIRILLEKAIYEPIVEFMDNSESSCRFKITYEFFQELRRIDLFPSLETTAAKQPLTEIIDRLVHFRYVSPIHYDRGCRAVSCRVDFNEIVKRQAHWHENYFDGLCLDCIAKGKEKENPADSAEFKLNKGARRWDCGCRVRHSEPTWYYSYHAREEVRKHGPLTKS